jgi:hypothetical protein
MMSMSDSDGNGSIDLGEFEQMIAAINRASEEGEFAVATTPPHSPQRPPARSPGRPACVPARQSRWPLLPRPPVHSIPCSLTTRRCVVLF